MLRDVEKSRAAIFLDFGNYEAHRFDNPFWKRSPWLLKEAVTRLKCDVVFSHDRITKIEGVIEKIKKDLFKLVVEEWERDSAATNNKISPIVHAPMQPDGSYASQVLPELCHLVAKKCKPEIIAVAERELGDGILMRARRVRSIRRSLDRLAFKQPLHILGTGNPLSMMILSLAGGTVFDGLEWCRTVIDANSMRLHHFHHFDLFRAQRSQIEDEFLREFLLDRDELVTEKAKAILHNLYFFKRFAADVQQAHQQGAYDVLFEKYLPGEYGRIVRFMEAETL